MSLRAPLLARAMRPLARRLAPRLSRPASSVPAAASPAVSKAADGLSRVASAAGPLVSAGASRLASILTSVGGRTGRVIVWTEKRAMPWLVHYARVGLEVSRIVIRDQRMSPPSVATVQSYLQHGWQAVRAPGQTMQRIDVRAAMRSVRALGTPQMVAGAVVLAECLGFFSVGEMLGKLKIVGYHGKAPGDAAHH